MSDIEPREPIVLRVESVLAKHILLGYGRCSCGEEFTRYGNYSADHRAHVAQMLAPVMAEMEGWR